MSSRSTTPDADAVARAVSIFLTRLLEDDSLGGFFEGIDLERVQQHTRAIVIAALGGPDLYVGRDMRAVHAPFNLRDRDFDAAVDHLVASLREVGLGDSLASMLGARLEPLRSQIVAD
jgi:hemoglobin